MMKILLSNLSKFHESEFDESKLQIFTNNIFDNDYWAFLQTCNGGFWDDNLVLKNWLENIEFSASISRQIFNAPNGTKFKIENSGVPHNSWQSYII